MNLIRIEDARDARLIHYAGVREPKLLRERELLIAEGRFVVRRLIDSAMDIGEFVGTTAARGRLALILGTEGHGLTAEALFRADIRLRIPMTGALDSLNIATAARTALPRLHEARRRRLTPGSPESRCR